MRRERWVPPLAVLLVLLHLRERERSHELLDESLAARDYWLTTLDHYPGFDLFRDDPRFEEVRSRVFRTAPDLAAPSPIP